MYKYVSHFGSVAVLCRSFFYKRMRQKYFPALQNDGVIPVHAIVTIMLKHSLQFFQDFFYYLLSLYVCCFCSSIDKRCLVRRVHYDSLRYNIQNVERVRHKVDFPPHHVRQYCISIHLRFIFLCSCQTPISCCTEIYRVLRRKRENEGEILTHGGGI
jgi:hypothetical protein